MTINLNIPNAKKVIPNIATSISEIKARIIDGIEHGYDDAQQVYENLEDEFYEGLSKLFRRNWVWRTKIFRR